MQLRITDGTTTVDLSGGTTGISGCTYFPLAAGQTDASVGEQAELVCAGTTAANIRSALNSVENLLEGAARRTATGKGPRVFLEYKPADADSLYRSEVYAGRLVFSEEPGARRFGDVSAAGPGIKCALALERAPWWEGPETEVQLSAQGQSAATGGRTLTNNGTDDWVQAAAEQVPGTLPAPVRLRLINNTGSNRNYRYFYVGVNAFSDPANFGGVIQGESAATGGSTVANGTCSGGNYRSFSATTGNTIVGQWTIPTAMMQGGGRWFRLLVRMFTYNTAHAVKLTPVMLDYFGLITLWEGDQVALPSALWTEEMIDLGSVPLPPGEWDTSYAQVRLGLRAQASTTSTIGVDFLQCVAMDGYRQVQQLGMEIANNNAVEFDEIEGRFYSLEGTGRHPIHVARGSGLYLWPGRINRINVLHDSITGSSTITHTFSARAWIRARRQTV